MFKRASVYLAIAGVVLAIMLVKQLRHVEPPPPPLKEPTRAPFAESIGARGIIESVDENVRIAPAVAALVKKVNVKVGDEVKAGDVLLEQDARDASAVVAAEEAQIATLRAQIDEAQIALADKKDSWDRMEKLSENKVSSIDERQRARFAAQMATATLGRVTADLHAAEAQLGRAKTQLDLLTVKAPRDGTILQVNVRAGEWASLTAQEPAILLGNLREFQLRADVDEDNASRVRPGCDAVAFIKGRRENPIPLRFVRIEPYIIPKRSLTGESSERVDTRVLQVIFRFEQPSMPVYAGQQMDVFLEAGPSAAAVEGRKDGLEPR